MNTTKLIGNLSQSYSKIEDKKDEAVIENYQKLSIASIYSETHQSLFSYEKALLENAGAIDTLMSTEGIHDSDKIVVLPNKFRRGSIESAIKCGRIFVARKDEMVVGYKKLFVLKEAEERNNTLTHEIRCLNGHLIDAYIIKTDGCRHRVMDPLSPHYNDNDIYIYDGADFTKKEFRGKGINKELTNRAFSLIKEDVQKLILEKKAERIFLVYGLTHPNDYNEKGEGKSRTPSIVDAFTSFAHALTGTYPEEVLHYRYRAFMPTFDLNSQECRPKDDSESIPGYGNVLSITL